MLNSDGTAFAMDSLHVGNPDDLLHRRLDNPYIDTPKTVTVIGAPMTYGQPLEGVQHGPEAIRNAGLRELCTGLGWRYRDLGDLPEDPPVKSDRQLDPAEGNAQHCESIGRSMQRYAETVSSSIAEVLSAQLSRTPK